MEYIRAGSRFSLASPHLASSFDMAILSIVGGSVALLESEETISVSASQIREIVQSGSTRIDGEEIRVELDDQLERIVFMSRVLEPSLLLDLVKSHVVVRAVVDSSGELLDVGDTDHILLDGQWFPIDSYLYGLVIAWISEISTDGKLPLGEYARLFDGIPPDIHVIDRITDEKLAEAAQQEASPQSLHAKLYPYQKTGYYWLRNSCDAHIGGILGDEMGLGKTLQVIAVLTDRKRAGQGPSMVIAPVTIIENWRREFAKFSPAVRVYVHLGPGRVRSPNALQDFDILITSYETAVNDIGLLMMIEWDLTILDEAQAIKNPGSLRASILRTIPRKSSILVTGTPLENSTLDVWALCDFVIPGYFGTSESFETTYSDDPDYVRRALKPLLLRREVDDVGSDLPEKITVDTALVMSESEQSGYDELLSQLRSPGDSANSLEQLMRMRQFTGHPSLLDESLATDPMNTSVKLSRLIEILSEIFQTDQKALVFSEFTNLSDLISQTVIRELGVNSVVMDGRTQPTARQQIVDGFSELLGPALLVLHPKTGGAGINITAANHVIHYTLPWNPATEAQATARAYRRGQERNVFVHRLYYANSVDELVLQTLDRKLDLSQQVVEPSDQIAISLLTRATQQLAK